MKILIANLLIAQRSGTEVFTEQLADGFRRAGHDPVVWVSLIGPQGEALRHRGHTVIDRLDQLPWKPDIIHGHHNVMTATAVAGFPGVPAVFVCHDASASFDTPPYHPRIRSYLAVDELCRRRMAAGGVAIDQTELLLNAVDELRYARRQPLPIKAARALVLTKHSGHLGAVRSACQAAGLELDELGSGVVKLSDRLEDVFPQYDIVFATARMAQEAAFAGCAVVVCDDRGLAGMLTRDNLEDWLKWNLGRGLLSQPTTHDGLVKALSLYDATDADRVTDYLRVEANLSKQIEKLSALYHRCIDEQAKSPNDSSLEALATASFMEDWLPTNAKTRPWRKLSADISSTEVDHLSHIITRVGDDFFQRLSSGLAHLGQTTSATEIAGALRRWTVPAQAFFTQLGVLQDDHIIAPLIDHSNHAIYGPYKVQSSGVYEVFFDISLENPSGEGVVRIDVAVGAYTIASREIAASMFDGVEPIVLSFKLESNVNLVEYRVAIAGFDGGSIKFGGVTLIRQ